MNKNKETKDQKMSKIVKELESKSSPMLFLLRRLSLFGVYIASTLAVIFSFATNISKIEGMLNLSYISLVVAVLSLASYEVLNKQIKDKLLKTLNTAKDALERQKIDIEETNSTTVVTDVDGLEICLVTFFAVSKTPNPNIVLKISEKTKLIIVDNPVDPDEPWILLNKEMQDGKIFIRKEVITEDEVKKLMDQKTFLKIINIRNELLESGGKNG
jgi:hypothetical protein